MSARLAALLALSLATACSDPRATPGAGQHASPNARILPAPLAAASELSRPAATTLPGDAAPLDSVGRTPGREPTPPAALMLDRPLGADTLGARETAGLALTAEFRWQDVPEPPAAPEVAASAIQKASQRAHLRIAIDLAAAGRMRFVLTSAAFSLPVGSELRSRISHYGHLLVWPDQTVYRNVPAGALRALFQERRLDASPLLRAKVGAPTSGNRLGHKTVIQSVETSLGALSLEQATLPGTGSAGELLCRLMVELIGAEPSAEVCRTERLPLSAQYRWAPAGSLELVVTGLTERKDLPENGLLVPPRNARFTVGELPESPSPLIVSEEELGRIRQKPIEVTPTRSPKTPGEGLVAENRTTLLQYLLLDGIPVAWVQPMSEVKIRGPLRGRYQISWRDFFGTNVSAPSLSVIPGFVRVGSVEADGGGP